MTPRDLKIFKIFGLHRSIGYMCKNEEEAKRLFGEKLEEVKELDLAMPPALEKMLDDIKAAKNDLNNVLGISSSRTSSGLIRPFDPEYDYTKMLMPPKNEP
jgi:hypothetical protein